MLPGGVRQPAVRGDIGQHPTCPVAGMAPVQCVVPYRSADADGEEPRFRRGVPPAERMAPFRRIVPVPDGDGERRTAGRHAFGERCARRLPQGRVGSQSNELAVGTAALDERGRARPARDEFDAVDGIGIAIVERPLGDGPRQAFGRVPQVVRGAAPRRLAPDALLWPRSVREDDFVQRAAVAPP